ncbi:hypothetical protein Tco_0031616 [Tanacetum coccineum]
MPFSKRRSVKVKELRERCIIKDFKLSNQEKYEHVDPKVTSFTRWRSHKMAMRLCLVDDLKMLKITYSDTTPSASALQVLRRLGSIFTSMYAAIQKLKKDSWKELQFSLVDNSKLNIVHLLNRS